MNALWDILTLFIRSVQDEWPIIALFSFITILMVLQAELEARKDLRKKPTIEELQHIIQNKNRIIKFNLRAMHRLREEVLYLERELGEC